MKRFNTITGIIDTGLVTLTVITGGISIAVFASRVGLPVGIALDGTSCFFLLQLSSHENLLKSSLQSKKNTMLLSCLPKAS